MKEILGPYKVLKEILEIQDQVEKRAIQVLMATRDQEAAQVRRLYLSKNARTSAIQKNINTFIRFLYSILRFEKEITDRKESLEKLVKKAQQELKEKLEHGMI